MPSAATAAATALNTGERPRGFCCAACGGRSAGQRPVLLADPVRRPFDLLRCAECGLVQQHPRYTAEQITGLYDEGYYVFSEAESSRWARAVQQYAVHLARWETAAPDASPGLGSRRTTSGARRRGYRRLLDLGCALGHLSALAARRGWRVVGMDISPEAISRAVVRFGHDFRAGTLAQHRETLPPFDVVFLGDVIEHVPEPVECLQDVRRVLAPNGVVCIDTPNWGGRWRRWGGRHWLGLNRFHINLFDADALAALLLRCGFGDVRMNSTTHYRYESWANRPEPQAIVRKMPAPLAWRMNRFLDRRSRRKPWASLRQTPPGTIDEAIDWVRKLAPRDDSWRTPRLSGDNLIATAVRA